MKLPRMRLRLDPDTPTDHLDLPEIEEDETLVIGLSDATGGFYRKEYIFQGDRYQISIHIRRSDR